MPLMRLCTLIFSLLCLLALSSYGLANTYIKPTLELWSYVDRQGLELEQTQQLPHASWTYVEDNIYSSKFLRPDSTSPSADSVLWLKIKIPATTKKHLWLEFVPDVGINGTLAQWVDGQWKWSFADGRVDNDNSLQPLNYLTFKLNTQNEPTTAYLKLNSSLIYLFRANTLTQEGLIWQALKNNLFNGFIIGFLCLAMVYSLIIGSSAGDKMFLYYSFYVLCNTLYILVISGYLRILFPYWEGLGNMSNLAALLMTFAALSFIREFLTTETTIPKTDNLLKFAQVAAFLSLIFATFLSDFQAFIVTEVFAIGGSVLVLFAAVSAYRAGHPYAKYFLLAWGIFIATIMVWSSMWLGVFKPTPLVAEIFKIGSLLEITLLALVLGYRYKYLKAQAERLRIERNKYHELSETDPLTGVLNRRCFLNQAQQLFTSGSGNDAWLAINIDQFKNFNDQHGLAAGDKLLTEFGAILSNTKRHEDIAARAVNRDEDDSYRCVSVGRLSGDEFAVILTDCNLPRARLYAERLLEEFHKVKVSTTEHDERVGTSVSIGTTMIHQHDSLESAWRRAESLQAEAKKRHGNRVISDDEIPELDPQLTY